MSLLYRLLEQLGVIRTSKPRQYRIDAALHPALDALAKDQQRSPDEIASHLVAEGIHRLEGDEENKKKWEILSPREQEVAALVCLGLTNRQIAARLSLSPETIKTHVRNVLIKFDLSTKAELRQRLSNWDFSPWM